MTATAEHSPTEDNTGEDAWDLSDLLDGDGPEGVLTRLDQALELADVFAQRWDGAMEGIDSEGLAAAMGQLAQILELISRAGTYAMLRFSVDTADPEIGALVAAAQQRATAIETRLLFFELQWAALDTERAEELLGDERLEFCGHHLRNIRLQREHLLSEAEERIVTEKSLTGVSAWTRLFEQLTSGIEVTFGVPGAQEAGARETDVQETGVQETVALDVALSRLGDPDGEVRRAAAAGITAALQEGCRTRAFIYNTLCVDKMVEDRLRGYPHWLAARNLANEVSDESVAALVKAVKGRYELARRWYRLKARLLGIERLADYDRIAAVGEREERRCSFEEAKEIVLDCYEDFSPVLGSVVKRLFDERHIDVPVRPAKRGGAFCASAVPAVDPYVMLNFTSRRRDVLVLAHELGHAVHFALAAQQGIFHQDTPLTLAETASVFGETIVLERMLAGEDHEGQRLALLAQSIEDAIATVFRQVAMHSFEDEVHTARAQEGELSVDRLGDIWVQTQTELLGDSVQITEGYRSWWSYIPHFIATPGYVYAYAYGQLLALSVYERHRQGGEDFVPGYLRLLGAGGSRSPERLGELVGVDLADPGFWDRGLDLVERRLRQAEDAAQTVLRDA